MTLTKVRTAQARLVKADRAADTAALNRDAALLDAQEAGASYADLEAATGLSSSRVTQVLRRERERRTTAN